MKYVVKFDAVTLLQPCSNMTTFKLMAQQYYCISEVILLCAIKLYLCNDKNSWCNKMIAQVQSYSGCDTQFKHA